LSLEDLEQVTVSATKSVSVAQSIPEAEPVIGNRDLEVLEAAVGPSQSGLDLKKDSGQSTEITESGRHAIQARQSHLTVLTSGLMRVGGHHRSDSTSALKPSDVDDLGLAVASNEVPGEPVAKAGGFSVQRKSRSAKPRVAVVSPRVDGGLHQNIPIAIVLAVIALIALIPVSRRRVTHADLSSMSRKYRRDSQSARLGWS
jgi:hypothetical protein